MITIFIDNKPYGVKTGQNLLQACLSLGFDLPYFCWHPAMHSVGACRQCAVKQFKDEYDTRGRIVMSCMTPLAEGMRISVDDPDAKAFRAGITEFLMVNHPHDCPVCDEGGECHLQDMTVMTGHTYRHTRFKKRTHRNQDLGPFINHEMNRCIACYRCVRFYRGIAGGRDLNVFASHHNVYFGRHKDGVLESEFSGNLVEICPTGVFTDKTFKKHYARKWDLQTAPSICVHCGLGCNTIAGERYGTLRRILNRYNREVNGYFLCDRGRFGYEFVNSGKRIRQLLMSPSLIPSHQERDDKALSPGGEGLGKGGHERIDKAMALRNLSDIISKSKTVIGIGSPRASLESNFALRTFVGPENFYSGMSIQEHELVKSVIDIMQKGPARTPSLRDVQMADAVLVLGEDLTNIAPLLALAVRQAARNSSKEKAASMHIPDWDDNAVRNAAQNETGPLYIASIAITKLDDIATKAFQASPDDIVRLGFAIAHELASDAPAVSGVSADISALAAEVAQALKNARRPLIISGTSLNSEAIMQAAANIAWVLCKSGKQAALCYTVPECNSLGSGLLGGNNLDELLMTPSTLRGEGGGEGADTVIILENDLYRRAEQNAVDAFLSRARHVIVLDHLFNPTSKTADILLPAGTFSESSGTIVNNEGRAQRYYQVFVPTGEIQSSWKWIHDIMSCVGSSGAAAFTTLDSVTDALIASLPIFGPIKDIAPSAAYTIQGQKIPRQPHRYSGRTAMHADVNLHEPKPPEDADSPLAYSMEGYAWIPPAPLLPRYWSPGWNSVQALNKFQQEIGGPLRGGDPGKRLIEPKQDAKPSHFAADSIGKSQETGPSAPARYNIFGSEELSSYSPAIVERAQLSDMVNEKKP